MITITLTAEEAERVMWGLYRAAEDAAYCASEDAGPVLSGEEAEEQAAADAYSALAEKVGRQIKESQS